MRKKYMNTHSAMVNRCLDVSIWTSMLPFSNSIRFLLISICWRKASRSCSLSWSISARLWWLEWAWTSATRDEERGSKEPVLFKRAAYNKKNDKTIWLRGRGFTLDMADVSPVRVKLAACLICDLRLEPLDLAAQV